MEKFSIFSKFLVKILTYYKSFIANLFVIDASDVQKMTEEQILLLKDLSNLVGNSGYIHAFSDLVFEDFLLMQGPPSKRVCSFELSLLLLALSQKAYLNMEEIDSHKVKLLKEETRNILEKFHHTFLPNISTIDENPSREDISKLLEEHFKTEDFISEGFLYAADDAYPLQYPEQGKYRYSLDTEWILLKKGLTIEKMFYIARDLLEEAHSKAESIKSGKTSSLECLLVDINKIDKHKLEDINRFLDLFSTNLNNKQALTIENALLYQARPILRINKNTILFPSINMLFKAIAESPLYWMLEDEQYAEDALRHRGDLTEAMVYSLACNIFGKNNVFKDVKIKRGDRDITDIDTLVIYRNKAIIFQVKSKKVSLLSRLGNYEKMQEDFNISIQKAYDQGITSIISLKDNNLKFLNGKEKIIIPHIDDFYLFCVTTEYFPNINLHKKEYLKIDEKYKEIVPFTISAFDLEMLSQYLYDPFDFIYYLYRRSSMDSKIGRSEEMSCFVNFMDMRLVFQGNADFIYLGSDFIEELNKDFYTIRSKDDVDKRFKWKHPGKESLISLVKTWDDPRVSDLVISIYENYQYLLPEMAKNILEGKKDILLSVSRRPDQVLILLNNGFQAVGRNDMCPCGSCKKYKKCCGR